MKLGFVFKLQALLMLRERTKDEAMKSYVRVLQQRLSQEEICAELQGKMDSFSEDQIKNLPCFRPADRIHIWNALLEVEEKLAEAKEGLRQLKVTEEKHLNLFMKAKQSVEVLDKLKHNQEATFYDVQRKTEEKAIDDWVQGTFVKKVF